MDPTVSTTAGCMFYLRVVVYLYFLLKEKAVLYSPVAKTFVGILTQMGMAKVFLRIERIGFGNMHCSIFYMCREKEKGNAWVRTIKGPGNEKDLTTSCLCNK